MNVKGLNVLDCKPRNCEGSKWKNKKRNEGVKECYYGFGCSTDSWERKQKQSERRNMNKFYSSLRDPNDLQLPPLDCHVGSSILVATCNFISKLLWPNIIQMGSNLRSSLKLNNIIFEYGPFDYSEEHHL